MWEINFLFPEGMLEALALALAEVEGVEVVQGWVNSQGGSWSWGTSSGACLVGVGVGWGGGLDGFGFGFGLGLGAMVSPGFCGGLG
jgi:hypothetical protein